MSVTAEELQQALDDAAAGNLDGLVSLLDDAVDWRGLERGHWLWRRAPS